MIYHKLQISKQFNNTQKQPSKGEIRHFISVYITTTTFVLFNKITTILFKYII